MLPPVIVGDTKVRSWFTIERAMSIKCPSAKQVCGPPGFSFCVGMTSAPCEVSIDGAFFGTDIQNVRSKGTLSEANAALAEER